MNYKKIIRALYLIRDEIYEKIGVKKKKSKSNAEPKGLDLYVKSKPAFFKQAVSDSEADSELDKMRKAYLYNPACDEAHEIEFSPAELEFMQSLNINYENPTEADLEEIQKKIEELYEEFNDVVNVIGTKVKKDTIVINHQGNEIDLTNYVQYNQQEAIRRLLEFDDHDDTEDIVDIYVTLFYALRQAYFPNSLKEKNILKRKPVIEDEYTYSEHIENIKEIEKLFGKGIVFKVGGNHNAYICPRPDRFLEALLLLKKLRRETKQLYDQKLMELGHINLKDIKSIKNYPHMLAKSLADLDAKMKYLNYFNQLYIAPTIDQLGPIIDTYSKMRQNSELRERDPQLFRSYIEEMGRCLSEIEYYSLSTRYLAYENIKKLSPEVLTYMEENNIEIDMGSFNRSIREYRHERIKRAYQKVKFKER